MRPAFADLRFCGPQSSVVSCGTENAKLALSHIQYFDPKGRSLQGSVAYSLKPLISVHFLGSGDS